jgi:hypothetical protein
MQLAYRPEQYAGAEPRGPGPAIALISREDASGMTKATAKLRWAASKLGALFNGKHGVLATLEAEHTEVRSLIADLRRVDDPAKVRAGFMRIRQDLLIHMHGEEQGVYAELGRDPAGVRVVGEAVGDHVELERLLESLDRISVTQPQWREQLIALEAALAAHVAFEHGELYELAKQLLDDATLRRLDDEYHAYREGAELHGELIRPRIRMTG